MLTLESLTLVQVQFGLDLRLAMTSLRFLS